MNRAPEQDRDPAAPDAPLGYSYDTGLTSEDGNPVDFDVSNYTYLNRDTGESLDYYDTMG